MRTRTTLACLLLLGCLGLAPGALLGQVMSSGNYSMEKSAVSGGGGSTESASFAVSGSSGQSSPPGDTQSENFSSNTGVLDDTDLDGDGVLVDKDACPLENATGFDADQDGCIDTIAGLIAVVAALPDGDLSDRTKTSLTAKARAALGSTDRNRSDTAIRQLTAFINEVTAQQGKKAGTETAQMLVLYAENIIARIRLG